MELFFIDHECEAFFELTKCCCVFKLFKCIRTFFVFHFFFVNLLLLPYKVHCVFTNNSNVLFAIMSMNNGAQVEDPKKKKKKKERKNVKLHPSNELNGSLGIEMEFSFCLLSCADDIDLSVNANTKKNDVERFFFFCIIILRDIFSHFLSP